MRTFTSAGLRPGAKSTSIPRAAKISAARGLKASEINTFGIQRSVSTLNSPQRHGVYRKHLTLFTIAKLNRTVLFANYQDPPLAAPHPPAARVPPSPRFRRSRGEGRGEGPSSVIRSKRPWRCGAAPPRPLRSYHGGRSLTPTLSPRAAKAGRGRDPRGGRVRGGKRRILVISEQNGSVQLRDREER